MRPQDDVISQNWFFRLLQRIICLYSRIMYNFTVEGWHKLPKDGPALLVSTHTSHSTDILICCLTAHKLSGRVVRGLLHRLLVSCMPWLRYLGLVPGYRDSAIQLLRQGHWVAVIPGGAEEIAHHISDHGSNGSHRCDDISYQMPVCFDQLLCSFCCCGRGYQPRALHLFALSHPPPPSPAQPTRCTGHRTRADRGRASLRYASSVPLFPSLPPSLSLPPSYPSLPLSPPYLPSLPASLPFLFLALFGGECVRSLACACDSRRWRCRWARASASTRASARTARWGERGGVGQAGEERWARGARGTTPETRISASWSSVEVFEGGGRGGGAAAANTHTH